MDSLHEANSSISLEIESQSELQFTHRGTTFQTCNSPIVPNAVNILAIYASLSSVVCAESVNRMIKHIECIHAELQAKPLGNQESFRERQVGIETLWSMKNVPTKVSDSSACWRCERPGDRSGERAGISSQGQSVWIRICQWINRIKVLHKWNPIGVVL